MDKIIATVIVLIVVLGLIAYAILPQQEGVKQVGEKGIKEQDKIAQMVSDPNKVTGTSAKSYISLGQKGVTFTFKKVGGTATSPLTISDTTTATEIDTFKGNFTDSGLYTMKKSYKTDGTLGAVEFTEVDLSK